MQFYPRMLQQFRYGQYLKNEGTEEIGLEYVSSFIYQGLCQSGEKPYFEKTSIYTPHATVGIVRASGERMTVGRSI